MYLQYNNFDILNASLISLFSDCNDTLINECTNIADYIIKNHNKEKTNYARTLFNAYLQIEDINYKKEILIIMKKLLDSEAKGFFSKSDFKNSKNIKQDVDKLCKAFKKNKALQMYRKELFSRKKKK